MALTPEIEDAIQVLADATALDPQYPDSEKVRRTLEALGDANAIVLTVERSERTAQLLREFADRVEAEQPGRVEEVHTDTFEEPEVAAEEPEVTDPGAAGRMGEHVPERGFGAPQPKVRKRKGDLVEEDLVVEQPKQRE